MCGVALLLKSIKWSGLPLCRVGAVFRYIHMYTPHAQLCPSSVVYGSNLQAEYMRRNSQPCDRKMPRGCYRCPVDYFVDENTCHWIYLTEPEADRMVKANVSRGLVIWGQRRMADNYCPLCPSCVAWYLNKIELSTRPQFDGFDDEATEVLSHAVLEYVTDRVTAGKLQGGWN